MANPVFSRSPIFSAKAAANAPQAAPQVPTAGQLEQQYAVPSPGADELGRMTYEDTIVKTAISFGILLVGAVVGWMLGGYPIVTIGAALIGLVLALVNIFKKEPSPALVLAYAAVEGVFVGGISMLYALLYGGSIVPMAVFGTLGVVGVTLALFASGKVRASKRATKIFMVAIVGYAAFSLVNFGLMMFGVTDSMFGLRDGIAIFGIPLGVPLGILVVLLAAYSLVLDFDGIQRGVTQGAPRKFAWTAAFGIMVTVIWLYLEILRLIAIVMGRR
ncbi:MAG: Bax inhibitor-1/YccA family protein [Microbacteriaceae bacterium]|nr:Bax inhibitor-1/YccA family protein [Microbacteriaceae bacterium]